MSTGFIIRSGSGTISMSARFYIGSWKSGRIGMYVGNMVEQSNQIPQNIVPTRLLTLYWHSELLRTSVSNNFVCILKVCWRGSPVAVWAGRPPGGHRSSRQCAGFRQHVLQKLDVRQSEWKRTIWFAHHKLKLFANLFYVCNLFNLG